MSLKPSQQSSFPSLSSSLSPFPMFMGDLMENFRNLTNFPALQQLEDLNGLSVTEDNSNFYVEANMPGLEAKDIEIDIDDNDVLWIRGEKKEESRDKNLKVHRKARTSFSYRLKLAGINREAKEPDAVLKNGVMTITFPKSQKSKSRRIGVKKG